MLIGIFWRVKFDYNTVQNSPGLKCDGDDLYRRNYLFDVTFSSLEISEVARNRIRKWGGEEIV